MSAEIYLGEPPERIKRWIIDHAETRITFSDGSSDTYEWSGTINQQTMIDAGLFDADEWTWIKQPVTVDIGNTVTSIGDDAFYSCSRLTSITIGDGVKSIGEGAFYCCSGMTSVTIPDSVKSIGDYVFGECSGLTSVTFNSFTKNEVKSMTTNDHLFGDAFYYGGWKPKEKSFTVTCPNDPDESKSMTVHFSADEHATITFTEL